LFGYIPKDLDIPVYPFSRWKLLKDIFPDMLGFVKDTIKAYRKLPRYLATNPDRCTQMTERVKSATSAAALLSVWQKALRPYITEAWWAHAAGSSDAILVMALRKKLAEMAGDTDKLLREQRTR
jgi:pyruvate,water dikinase